MKKKFLAILTALILVLGVVPAMAAEYYGGELLYDATGLLSCDAMEQAGAQLETLSKELKLEIHTDIVDDTEGRTLDEYSKLFYEHFEYGTGDAHDGILLMIEVETEEDGCAYVGMSLYGEGTGSEILTEKESDLKTELTQYLNDSMFAGGASEDGIACAAAVEAFAAQVYGYAWENTASREGAGLGYITDTVGLLTAEEAAALEEAAAAATADQNRGIYAVILNDFADYYDTENISDAANQIIKDYNLGTGEDRAAILLLISSDDLEYCIVSREVYVDTEAVKSAFIGGYTDSGWYAAIDAYVKACAAEATVNGGGSASAVTGFDRNGLMSRFGISLFVGCIVALIVCLILKGKLKSVGKQTRADAYIPDDGVEISRIVDQYTHTTETRKRKEGQDAPPPPPHERGAGRGGPRP